MICTMKLWKLFLVAQILAAGCGNFKLPKPAEPVELARVRERIGTFQVIARDGTRLSPEDFSGRALVLLGAEPGFVAELLDWARPIVERWGRPGKNYAAVAILEGGAPKQLLQPKGWLGDTLEELERLGVALAADPRREFAKAMGFVGEGPHVAAAAPDGTLLILIDGTAERARVQGLFSALDSVVAPAAR